MNSLRARLLTSAGCMLLGFVLLTAYSLDSADRQRAEAAVHERLQGLVYTLLGALDLNDAGELTIDDTELPDPRLNRPGSGLAALIVSPDGSILWHSFSTLDLNINVPPTDVGQWRFRTADSAAEHFRLVFGISWAVDEQEQLFRLAVIESGEAFFEQRQAFRRSLWLGLGLAALALLLLLLAILHWGLLPIGRLAREVNAVQEGDEESISGRYPTELQPLATALNAMLRNERRRQSRYRNALADLAHSLKTPLAALRNQLHASGQQSDALEQMQQLIDYQLHKASAGGGRSFVKPLALRPLVDRLVAALGKVHAERGLRFEIQIPDSAQLRMEQGDILEIMGNLLDNAARFAREKIRVMARQQGRQLLVQVCDDGPGFPASEREALLQRGVRADSQHPGQGIGLAVVAEIVSAHTGRIELTDAEGGGGCVNLILPNH